MPDPWRASPAPDGHLAAAASEVFRKTRPMEAR
jgi:hypothetical protein